MNSAALGTLALLTFLVADRAEFTLHPAESQIALLPGEHAVVTLYVEGASNRAAVELTASAETSDASAWLSMNPKVFSLKPGGMERILVTVKVPRTAAAGTYQAGVLIEPGHDVRSAPRSSDVFRITIRVLPSASVPEWREGTPGR